MSPQQPKREIVKGEKRRGGRGERHQKRSGGIRSEREFTTLFLCAEPAGLEITNVSRGRAPAVSREGEEEEEEEMGGEERRANPLKQQNGLLWPRAELEERGLRGGERREDKEGGSAGAKK